MWCSFGKELKGVFFFFFFFSKLTQCTLPQNLDCSDCLLPLPTFDMDKRQSPQFKLQVMSNFWKNTLQYYEMPFVRGDVKLLVPCIGCYWHSVFATVESPTVQRLVLQQFLVWYRFSVQLDKFCWHTFIALILFHHIQDKLHIHSPTRTPLHTQNYKGNRVSFRTPC